MDNDEFEESYESAIESFLDIILRTMCKPL